MKISTNNVINNFTDIRIHTKENSAPSVVSNDEHNFDAIIIQSDPRQIEEHTFAKSLSLQDRIASHTYHIDTHAIAARMLLL